MAQDHSVDLVSRVDLQELRNALTQAQKEIGTRFDFRGSSAAAVFDDAAGSLTATADHAAQLRSVLDVVETKLAKRGVPLNALVWGAAGQLPGGMMKQRAALQQGLSAEQAREITKFIKRLGLKVQPRIEGDAVRISGRQIDDLQAAVQAVRAKGFGAPIQAVNYR